jgi:hypothetical protein
MSRHWNGLITPLFLNSFVFYTYNSINAFEPMNRPNNRCIMQQFMLSVVSTWASSFRWAGQVVTVLRYPQDLPTGYARLGQSPNLLPLYI